MWGILLPIEGCSQDNPLSTRHTGTDKRYLVEQTAYLTVYALSVCCFRFINSDKKKLFRIVLANLIWVDLLTSSVKILAVSLAISSPSKRTSFCNDKTLTRKRTYTLYIMNLNPPRTPSRTERMSTAGTLSCGKKRKHVGTPQKINTLAPAALTAGCDSPSHKRNTSGLRTPLAKSKLNVSLSSECR